MKISNKLLIIITVLLSFTLQAQQYTIKGKLIDTKNQDIAYANLVLLQASDSTFVSGTTSEDNGQFIFDAIKPDNYILKTSFIGYKDHYKSINLTEDSALQTITLEDDIEELDGVVVKYRKPTIERKADRLIFKVTETALAEGNTLEALKQTPLVKIDDNITIKRENAAVYINDRLVRLSGEDLKTLLEVTPASEIEAIEVITTPSSEYDANISKVLKIKTSKNLILGYRGRVHANYKQARVGTYNGGISNFYKNQDISLFLNYNYTQAKINRLSNQSTNFTDGIIRHEDIDRLKRRNTHNIALNFDYFLDEQSTLSLSGNALLSPNETYRLLNNSNVFENTILDYTFLTTNTSERDKNNIGLDLDYVKKFDNNSKIKFNVHYTNYNDTQTQDVFTNYGFTPRTISSFFNDNSLDSDIIASQLDYNFKINDNINFYSGIKATFIENDSDVSRFDTTVNPAILDTNNSNQFIYSEDVFAAYVNADATFGKSTINLGLRAEQANTKGTSITNTENTTNDYFKLFPTINYTYTLSDAVTLTASYKRAINRPPYFALNPFNFYINDFNIVSGDPLLQPEIHNTISLKTILFDNFSIDLNYQHYNNSPAQLPIQDNITKIVTTKWANLENSYWYAIDLEGYFSITDRWDVSCYSSIFYINNQSNIAVLDTDIDNKGWSTYSEISNNFSFLKDNSLKAYLYMSYEGKTAYDYTRLEPRFNTSLFLTKSILKKKGTISLSFNDIFNTDDPGVIVDYGAGQNQHIFYNEDNRHVKLGFSYKFGNTTLQTNQNTKERSERDRLNQKG